MSYKNLYCYEQYSEFLAAAFEDLGFKVTAKDDNGMTLEERGGSLRRIYKTDIIFLMGATIGTIIKVMGESKETKNDQGRTIF